MKKNSNQKGKRNRLAFARLNAQRLFIELELVAHCVRLFGSPQAKSCPPDFQMLPEFDFLRFTKKALTDLEASMNRRQAGQNRNQ